MKTFKIVVDHKRHTLDELVYHFEAENELEALKKYINYDSRGDVTVLSVEDTDVEVKRAEAAFDVVKENTNERESK